MEKIKVKVTDRQVMDYLASKGVYLSQQAVGQYRAGTLNGKKSYLVKAAVVALSKAAIQELEQDVARIMKGLPA